MEQVQITKKKWGSSQRTSSSIAGLHELVAIQVIEESRRPSDPGVTKKATSSQ
jgi:hypothetical protein